MPVNEKLADRIREAIADKGEIEEKKMFSGICFMLNGKMYVCVRDEEMMCRIGPDVYESVLESPGCRPMIHNGKMMRGFVFVSEEALKPRKDFEHWIKLSLAFNKKAKSSKKPRK